MHHPPEACQSRDRYIGAADVAKGAYDAAAHQKDRNIAAAASALEVARAAHIEAEIAEIALRDHIEQHGGKS